MDEKKLFKQKALEAKIQFRVRKSDRSRWAKLGLNVSNICRSALEAAAKKAERLKAR
jgi:hypothetical protein